MLHAGCGIGIRGKSFVGFILTGSLLCICFPQILFFYGPTIRSRSRFSRKVMQSS
ncbi:hypothetical protein BDP27DRAFT_1310630 [Rhodocollybia butyracea]|uniref:Uncharacterized protein n=1 Tax=Rhodocollybia butyracea TaxID=206335 RepID=A0A9P5UG65_9AGAR|nr:hypothetical protein BDP27DRAFT_1310630 [Rhodocollybia butyracea]